MDHRIPSLSVADRIADGLRRRSGGPATHHASLHDDDDSVTLFEEDGLSRRCTVLPVKRSQSPSSTAELLAHSEDGATQQKEQPDPSESFIPIPLTPRPDPPSRAPTEASLQSTHTRASQIPRLPTPDFGNPSEKHTRTSATLSSFRSVFPRGLSFVSLHVPSTSFLSRTYTPASRRPQSVRSDSGESCGSAWSSCTTGSVDSGHTALIPSVGTTDKFTHKWPKPLSMRGLEMRGGNGRLGLGLGGITTAAAVLEEGRGLRTSSLQRWTTFKWCLLFSVCTVFAYGVAGLACAILTWFRSRLLFLLNSFMKLRFSFVESLGAGRCHVRGGQRYPHPHYFGCVYYGFYRAGGYLWGLPQFTPHPSNVHASSLACVSVSCRRWLHQLQTSNVCTGPQAELVVEPVLYPSRPTLDPEFVAVLWLL